MGQIRKIFIIRKFFLKTCDDVKSSDRAQLSYNFFVTIASLIRLEFRSFKMRKSEKALAVARACIAKEKLNHRISKKRAIREIKTK